LHPLFFKDPLCGLVRNAGIVAQASRAKSLMLVSLGVLEASAAMRCSPGRNVLHVRERAIAFEDASHWNGDPPGFLQWQP
jgi:hypothetical protein